jgi:hypothetical protein
MIIINKENFVWIELVFKLALMILIFAVYFSKIWNVWERTGLDKQSYLNVQNYGL